MLGSFLPGTGTGKVIPGNGFLEAVRRRHQQPKNLLDTRSEVSAKLKLSQNCEGDTLH